jgi:hypothetical protein
MSTKTKEKNIDKGENSSSNLINIIEKYYLPKDVSISKTSEKKNTDTNLSEYISLISTANNNNDNKNEISDMSITPSINEKNNAFEKIFKTYIVPYFTLGDLISLKKCNKMFNFLIDRKSLNICVISNSTKKFKSCALRASIWYKYLNVKEFNKELFQKENKKFENNELLNSDNDSEKKEELLYNKSLELIKKIKNNENEELLNIFTEEKIASIKSSLDIINRDIDRTFHNTFFEEENGKKGMRQIL